MRLVVTDGQLRKITAEVTKRIRKTLNETGKDEVDMISALNDSEMFSKVMLSIWLNVDCGELLRCLVFNSKWEVRNRRTTEGSAHSSIDQTLRRNERNRLCESGNS